MGEFNNVVNAEMDRIGNQLGTLLNEMAKTHAGRPVDEIKTDLAQRSSQIVGVGLDDEQLTAYAEQIAKGGGFNIDVQHVA